jgi:hypothetical protein
MNRRLRMRALALATAAAAGLALPAATSARIVFGRSIAGIRLGQNISTVKVPTGERPSIEHTRDGEGRKFTRYIFARYGVNVTAVGGNGTSVTQIQAFKPNERTVNGLHVGSSASAVRRALRHARCDSDGCAVGSRSKGANMTVFYFVQGRVIEIGLLHNLQRSPF